MNTGLVRLLEKLTSAEQAEVETFTLFVLARRRLRKLHLVTEAVSSKELAQLVVASGGFDCLDAPEENVYSVADGEAVHWPSADR
ncbi:MAG: hypothetical protein EXR54_05020 [Dehalococcoidia bacterium]|nr:hypothetical protein [Dehalococcoidia bacterium]MSQ16914.1 hypothetical protein [Dehalococcoidia bacterium]